MVQQTHLKVSLKELDAHLKPSQLNFTHTNLTQACSTKTSSIQHEPPQLKSAHLDSSQLKTNQFNLT